MSEEIISQTVVPAQPGFFKLWPWRNDDGSVGYRKDVIVAWVVTIWPRIGSKYGERTVTSDPVTTDVEGEDMGGRVAILRPDGMVEETNEAIVSLDLWLADPAMPERFR